MVLERRRPLARYAKRVYLAHAPTNAGCKQNLYLLLHAGW